MGLIPGLQSREFVIVSPDVFKDGPVQITSRWLSTEHKTLEADALKGAMTAEVWEHFVTPQGPASVPTPPVSAPDAAPAPVSQVVSRFPISVEIPAWPIEAPSERVPSSSPAPIPPRAESTVWPDSVLRTQLAVPQNEARRRISAWPGGQLRSGEEIVEVATEYLILWRAGLVGEKPDSVVPFLAKKILARETVYFDARLDSPTCRQLLHVDGGISFAPITDKQPYAIRDLDGAAQFDTIRREHLGFETASFPLIHPDAIVRKARDLFGIVPRDFDLVVLPVWRFGIRSGSGFAAKVRSLAIESVFGLEVQR